MKHVLWISMPRHLVQEITLQEALCGTTFEVAALDKRTLHVVSPPGEIIKPNDWKCIQDEGMPVHQRPFEKGNLYVHFKVRHA